MSFKFKFKALLTSAVFLLSCSINNMNVVSETSSDISSLQQDSQSSKENYFKQLEGILTKYPEAQKVFADWKPENKDVFDLKQDFAKYTSKSDKSALSKDTIQKILSEKPQVFQEGFQPVNFSKDQGEHISKITEWWYYNGHLKSNSGKEYGYELCMFRATPVIYFVHVALTDETNQKFYFDRIYYPPTKVKSNKETATVSYDNKQVMQQTGDFSYKLHGETDKFKFDLNLNMEKGPLMINGNGLIDMPEGKDSYYYSLTKLKTSGTVNDNGTVSNVEGVSWMDHQWGNFFVLRVGWDWFSFQMEDSTEYNLFSFRNGKDQTLKQFVNVLDSNNRGQSTQGFNIKRLDWWTSPHTSRLYVNKWQLDIPSRNEKFVISADNLDQEVFATKLLDIAPTYWEGSCSVTKTLPDGREVKGRAYVEHFAYKNKLP